MIEPVESLEFSRYLVAYLPTDSFVFGVSNSGTVSRTIEGRAARARARRLDLRRDRQRASKPAC